MHFDPGNSRWVASLTDAQLQQRVGPATFFRAKGYQESGHIRDLGIDTEGGRITGLISGSGRQVYSIDISPPSGSRGWWSTCTCPIGGDCKHVVAALLDYRAAIVSQARADRPDWELALHTLTTTSEAPRSADGFRALALEFAVNVGGRFESPPNGVQLRPLREDARRTKWVRTGATWNDITNRWYGGDLDPQQREALAQLYRLSSSTSYGYSVPATINLADLGPLAWPTLRQVAESGVRLLAGEGIRDVCLGDDPATVTLDLTHLPDGGLHAQARAEADNAAPDGRLFLLGAPAHGVGQLAAGTLHLWPLRSPVPEALRAFVDYGRQVDIPKPDVNRFLSLYYPALARRKIVSSSDGAVAVTEPSPPKLHLAVQHLPQHVSHLTWGYVYPAVVPGADDVVVPLHPSPGDPPRDHATETRLATHLAGLLATDDGYTHPTAAGRLLNPTVELRGLQLAPLLTETLPALRAADVVVTETGEASDYEEASEAPVVHLSSDDAGDRDWFNLHVTVTVDGQAVPFDQLFQALAVGDEALLLDSGTWFSLDLPELHALRRLIEEARELTDADPDGPLRIGPYQASLWEELVELGVVAQQSKRWHSSLEALLPDADRPALPQPTGLQAAMRPYQLAGYQWLAALWDARLGGILADDMGLGKTLQTLALLERARAAGDLDGQPVLVVAPASVVGTWVDEAAKFAPELRVVAITATGKKRAASLAASIDGAHVVVTSYTLMRLEDAEYRAADWSGLVLDEAQFVKNHRSRTYQAARRLGAPFTLAITGTPLENSLMDLWAMLSLAAPGLFSRPDHFIARYRKPIENDRDLAALDTLRRRIRPFVLRRTKREVVRELPEKIEQVQRVDLTPAHRKIYDKYLHRERQRVLGMLEDLDRNRVAIFRALTMLRQLALDPVLVDQANAGPASAKVETLVEQISELAAEGHRALVFSSFTGYLGLVKESLTAAGISFVYLDGRTRDRPARIAEFRMGTAPVFLISLKAGGFGLTLTEADYVFVLDPWWNPAAENQAIDRAHRIGQTRSVNVYRMVSTDTIEEKVVALQERKRDLFTSVVDSGTFSSGAITAADIRGLFED